MSQHFPLIQKEIGQVLGKNINFFNGANRLAIHLKDVLEERNLLNTNGKSGIVEFIDSSGKKEKQKRFYELLRKGSEEG